MVATSPARAPAVPQDVQRERLRKVLLHEQRTGCLDRAAVGGLERFVRQLQASLGEGGLPWLSGSASALQGYAGFSPEARRTVIARLLAQLDQPPLPQGQEATRPPDGVSQTGLSKGPDEPLSPEPTAAVPVRLASPAAPLRPSGRATPTLSPQAAVGELPGVGPKAVVALERLGIYSIKDLLYHFPRRHLDRRSVTAIADLLPGATATIFGTVYQVHTKRSPVQGLSVTDAIIQDDTGSCHAVWFNQPYLVRTLSRPGRVVLSGKVEVAADGAVQLASPELEFDSDDLLHTGRLVPFYGKTEGVSDKQMRTWVRLALAASAGQLREALPADVLAEARLMGFADALSQAHFPDDDAALAGARGRLAFDEFLLIQLGVLRRRRDWRESEPGVAMPAGPELLEEFSALLPFELTAAQRRVLDEVAADMAQDLPMSRLLQGDVGSGKTVVAVMACLIAVRNGYQAALMAPTEVLAQQHLRTVSRLLEPFGLRVELISGSLRRAEKGRVWGACAAGEIDVLIGTHALIQEDGSFQALGLAIVDEQHRFGVRQRGALRRKGYHPDVLVMTATPIPRTLALSVYGDLDVSVIDALPPGRRGIKTFPVSPDNRHRAYDFLRKQVRSGRQGFIICPLIDESDKIEARAAKAEHERLQRQFTDLRLALLHGKMSPKEKDAVMVAFRDGFVDVLVSTAVVEVGIDVPNATVMLIEGAERFGLSQLHQFRGRVGRGEHQSYCLLLSDSAAAEENPRLRAVVENHDGFALAEEDLKLRGPGEFFGTRQSGLPDLKVAKLSDVSILESARRQAQRIDARDPGLSLPEHALLKSQVDAFWRSAEEGA